MEKYKMNKSPRGHAIIFNHDHYQEKFLRKGTKIDRDSVAKCFSDLGFIVTIHDNKKNHEILGILKKVSQEDHTDNDCLAIIILTHGVNGSLCAADTTYSLETISNYFASSTCHSLANKPKLFFIQACRGNMGNTNSTSTDCGQADRTTSSNFKIPNHADFLFCHSTAEGHVAMRDENKGSPFIQTLVRELEENAMNMDLLHILTRVNYNVVQNYNYNGSQMPSFTSQLRRIVQFE